MPIFIYRCLRTDHTHEALDPWVTCRMASPPVNSRHSTPFDPAVKSLGGVANTYAYKLGEFEPEDAAEDTQFVKKPSWWTSMDNMKAV